MKISKLWSSLFLSAFMLLYVLQVGAQIPTEGLRLHLKANEGVSTTGAENFVTGWANQSPVSLANTTAPTEGTRPRLIPNVIGGQPVVRFTGGQYMNLPTASDIGIANSDYEIFIVYRSTSVFTNGMPGNVDIQFLLSGALEQYELHTNGNTGLRFIPNNVGATPAPRYIDLGTGGEYTTTEPHIIRLQASDTFGEMAVNGTDVQNNVKNARSGFESAIRMGIRADNSFPLEGEHNSTYK